MSAGGVGAEQPRLPRRLEATERRLQDGEVDEADAERRAGVAHQVGQPEAEQGDQDGEQDAAPLRGEQFAPESVGQRGRRYRRRCAGSTPSAASRPARAPRTAAAPSTRTAILVAITFIRRGTQNSSATIDRLDHSAPIQVAPMMKATTAAAAANTRAPSVPMRREVERGLADEVLDPEVRGRQRRPADLVRRHALGHRAAVELLRVVQALLAGRSRCRPRSGRSRRARRRGRRRRGRRTG